MQKQYALEHEIRLLDEQKAVKQKELEKLREKQKKNEAYRWKLLKIKCKGRGCTNSNDDCYCGGRNGCLDCENPELCGWCTMCDRMN